MLIRVYTVPFLANLFYWSVWSIPLQPEKVYESKNNSVIPVCHIYIYIYQFPQYTQTTLLVIRVAYMMNTMGLLGSRE